MLRITKERYGFEARVFGKHGDDIAASIAPTMQEAIVHLRRVVSGLPYGKRRDSALALIDNAI